MITAQFSTMIITIMIFIMIIMMVTMLDIIRMTIPSKKTGPKYTYF